jgi:hypothetical protein
LQAFKDSSLGCPMNWPLKVLKRLHDFLLEEVNAQHHLNAEGPAPLVLAQRMR